MSTTKKVPKRRSPFTGKTWEIVWVVVYEMPAEYGGGTFTYEAKTSEAAHTRADTYSKRGAKITSVTKQHKNVRPKWSDEEEI